jgi:hypothetical protein
MLRGVHILPEVWASLTSADKKALREVAYQRLEDYYADIGT